MKTLTPSHSPIMIVLFLTFLPFSDKFIPDPGSFIFSFFTRRTTPTTHQRLKVLGFREMEKMLGIFFLKSLIYS